MRAFLVTLNLILAGIVIAWLHSPPWDYRQAPRNQPNAVGAQSKTDAEKKGAGSSAPVLPLNDTKQAQNETNPTTAKSQQSSSEWTVSDKIATAVGIVALLQFIALVATWWVMVRTARRQLRAYVNFSLGNIVGFDAGTPVIQLVFKNFGQTPAYKVKVQITAMPAPYPLTAPLALQNVIYNFGVVGPTADFHVRLPILVPRLPDHINSQIVSNTMALYVFGIVTYENAFGSGRETTFRHMHKGSVGAVDGTDTYILQTCEDGNSAT